MLEATNNRLRQLRNLVGNTPLVGIDLEYKGKPRRIYAKAENLNMTGSIKDRMALHILRKGYERGRAGGRRPHRRGHQRQYRHFLFGVGQGHGPSCHDLHAGLDEPGAQGSHPQLGADIRR